MINKENNSAISTEEAKSDAPREEANGGKSGDGMNDLLYNLKSGSASIFTYDEKDRKNIDKPAESNSLVPQSFRGMNGRMEWDSKSQFNLGFKPFSLSTNVGKPEMPFSCSEWGKDSNLKASQSKYSDLHTGDKPYNASKGAVPKVNFSSGKIKYKCDVCDEDFLNRQTYDVHKSFCKTVLEAHLDSLSRPYKLQPRSQGDEKPFACTHCEFKCREKGKMKSHMDTHKEKPFACTQCDYTCPEKKDMKLHMDTHKEKSKYLCDIGNCPIYCESVLLLKEHKKIHEKRYSDIAKNPPRYNQTHSKQYPSNKSQTDNSKNYKYEKDHSRNDPQRKHNGLITGSNRNSHLSVTPSTHWAYVFATGYSTRTREVDVKLDIEENLRRKMGGKITYVQVEKVQTRYDTYRSFRISCRLANSKILMDSALWPENVKVKWYRHNRNNSMEQK